MLTTQGRVHSRQQPSTLEPVANWTTLSKGDEVAIYDDGVHVTSGEVEMRDPGGNVFWIMRNDGIGRLMIHRSDRIRVYRRRRKAHSHTRSGSTGPLSAN